jgi:hypothetical protein
MKKYFKRRDQIRLKNEYRKIKKMKSTKLLLQTQKKKKPITWMIILFIILQDLKNLIIKMKCQKYFLMILIFYKENIDDCKFFRGLSIF